VERDAPALGEIGRAVDVGVADPLEMRDDRNLAIALHAFDQRPAAARYDNVDEIGHAEHQTDGGAIARGHELHAIGGQTRGSDAAAEEGRDDARRVKALGTAAQDHGVARAQTQAAGISRDVWTRLVDDADDADRDTHARDVE